MSLRELIETLGILDAAGVDGAFVFTFAFPIYTYDKDPRYDLDIVSISLVKSCAGGKHGTTYPWHNLSRHAVGAKGVFQSGGRVLRQTKGISARF
ncbi:MAG: hypothetical protein ABSD89_01135 [Halobacteriota archaeon]